jgi:homoserine/homoserine lactone efflux protein
MTGAFIIASLLICISPGPSILVVVKHSVEGGIKRGLLSILGVVLADALLLTLSISGMGALIHHSLFWYTALKVMGAAYLIYLGGATVL